MQRKMSKRLIEELHLYCTSTDPADMIKEWYAGQRWVEREKARCICGVEIAERCEIVRKTDGFKLIVGNECIAHFGSDFLGYCARCYITPITSQSSHYCYDCGHNKKDRHTGIVTCGKLKGLKYPDAVKQDPEYCKYLLSIRGFNRPYVLAENAFLKYLDLCMERNTDDFCDIKAWIPPPDFETKHDWVLRISKHKGKTFKQVVTEDPSFACWVRQTLTFTDKTFRKYCIDYHESKVKKPVKVAVAV